MQKNDKNQVREIIDIERPDIKTGVYAKNAKRKVIKYNGLKHIVLDTDYLEDDDLDESYERECEEERKREEYEREREEQEERDRIEQEEREREEQEEREREEQEEREREEEEREREEQELMLDIIEELSEKL